MILKLRIFGYKQQDRAFIDLHDALGDNADNDDDPWSIHMDGESEHIGLSV